MIRILLILAVILLRIPSSLASPIVADLSNYNIAMDAGFDGTRIFVFGTRVDNGDVVVVVRGENKNYIIRKKEKIAGIWVNRDYMKFFNVPNFYVTVNSKPLSEIEQSELFYKLAIGEDFLIRPPSDEKKLQRFNEFKTAFLNYQHEQKNYDSSSEKINFMEETLFKTGINFSDNIPSGNYTAEIYLISGGEVVGMQSTPISVVKSGIDAFIYDFAHKFPATYGIAAIFAALASGWLAGRLFGAKS